MCAKIFVEHELYGAWYGHLPKGCSLCMAGLKVVVFISGLCGMDCFYCPISFERRRLDAFYADEEKWRKVEEIADEVVLVGARGASITGGEPFQRFDLTTSIIDFLKSAFGGSFHIHLYTSGYGASKDAIKFLDKLGLDEIRFHVVNDYVWKFVEFAVRNTSMSVGVEMPAIPSFDYLMNIVKRAEEIGADFVNLNELEAAEPNVDRLLLRGYRIRGVTVVGSREVALKVLSEAYRRGYNANVHFCPAIYKDAVQYRRRLFNKARNCSPKNAMVSADGLIVVGGNSFMPTMNNCLETVE